ncbi:MAG: LEPR-XLL domain-containing protein, partial [Verrucomicrobiales bacterium]|nr:LEPR-XLL domain-containing protein [Verrucomicrobiales bacterium]
MSRKKSLSTSSSNPKSKLIQRAKRWFFGDDADQDDRIRYEALEPRILYSGSPVVDDTMVGAQVAEVAAANATGSGKGEGGGSAPVMADMPPTVLEAQEAGALGSDSAASVADAMEELPGGASIARIGSAEVGFQYRIGGEVDLSQFSLEDDGAGTFALDIRGGDDTDDFLRIDLSEVNGSLDLFYDGGLGGFDTLEISGVQTGSYTPGERYGDGSIEIGNHKIRFEGLEPVYIDGAGLENTSFRFTTPFGADDLVIDSPSEGMNRIRGASGGVAFEELIFTNINEVIVDATSNDVAGSDADTVTIADSIDADGLQSLTILTGSGEDTLIVGLDEPDLNLPGGTVTFDGGEGSDRIVGSSANTTWYVTGEDEGNVYGMFFQNTENLEGSADNEDLFVFGRGASLSGVIDGGIGGFDSLEFDAGDSAMTNFTAWDAHSGLIEMDFSTIEYYGLEPITMAGGAAANVTLSGGDDNALVSVVGGQLTIASVGVPTFESISFTSAPTSLTIDALGGNDVVTVDSTVNLTLGGVFEIDAEEIVISNGAAIDAGSVRLSARDDDSVQATTIGDVADRNATVTVEGSVVASGAIVIESSVVRNVAINQAGAVSLDRESVATVLIADSASLDAGGSLTISALTDGLIDVVSGTSATSEFLESASVELGAATLQAGTLSVAATTSTNYNATARLATNRVSGLSEIEATGTTFTTDGNTELLAKDESEFDARTGNSLTDVAGISTAVSIDNSIAHNDLDRYVVVTLNQVDADVTAGNFSTSASREVDAYANVGVTSVSNNSGLGVLPNISFGGSKAYNVISGVVSSSVTDSEIDLLAGDLLVSASDSGKVEAVAKTSASTTVSGTQLFGTGYSVGASQAWNLYGIRPADPTALGIFDLMGADLGAPESGPVTALIEDSTVTVSGGVTVQAISSIDLDSEVTNLVDAAADGFSGTGASAGGAIFTSSIVNGGASATVAGDTGSMTVSAGGALTVSATDASTITARTEFKTSATAENGNPLSDSDATAFGGMLVRNQIESGTVASVVNAT